MESENATLKIGIKPNVNEQEWYKDMAQLAKEASGTFDSNFSVKRSSSGDMSLDVMKPKTSDTKTTGSGGIASLLKGGLGGMTKMLGGIGIIIGILSSLKPILNFVSIITKMVTALLMPIAEIFTMLLRPIMVMLKPIIQTVRTLMAPFRKIATQFSMMSAQAYKAGDTGMAFDLARQSMLTMLGPFITIIVGEAVKIVSTLLVGAIDYAIIKPILAVAKGFITTILGVIEAGIGFVLDGIALIPGVSDDMIDNIKNGIHTKITDIESGIDIAFEAIRATFNKTDDLISLGVDKLVGGLLGVMETGAEDALIEAKSKLISLKESIKEILPDYGEVKPMSKPAYTEKNIPFLETAFPMSMPEGMNKEKYREIFNISDIQEDSAIIKNSISGIFDTAGIQEKSNTIKVNVNDVMSKIGSSSYTTFSSLSTTLSLLNNPMNNVKKDANDLADGLNGVSDKIRGAYYTIQDIVGKARAALDRIESKSYSRSLKPI